MTLSLTIALLTAAGVYLILQRGMIRIILGFILLSHAANLFLFAAGNAARRDAPIGADGLAGAADPLPQAFVLTAIVIAFAITMLMSALAVTSETGDDTEDEG
ncbi:cation:proton antiporter [Arthrobacter sp. RIT-PI-e]|uniref:sodium:proton antiporter n=1 Tax=Arthrobacter sp. RIT-PI-e TaxID=1681197 RepID=UPI0006760610|nr:cation:proton antiporter subunit C [Arthrobacter sp. RIT-PI-e]KNC18845.1 cation:proton antiporter [Arthrobacter sp. RIT-PI-e]